MPDRAIQCIAPLSGAAHHQHRDIIRRRPLLLHQVDKPVDHLRGACRAILVGGRIELVRRSSGMASVRPEL